MSTKIQAIKHVAMNAANMFLTAIFGIYNVFGRTVNVGLVNFQAKVGVRHGIVHLFDTLGGGGIIKVPFVVDKPDNLINIGWLARQDLINQIEKMGFRVHNLEIEAGGMRKVYSPEAIKPMIVQSI